MNPLRRLPLLLILLAILVAAEPVAVTNELIRRANRAFEQGHFELAEQLYSQASLSTDDPGLIAFNRGVLLLQHNHDRDAELSFRRTLEDLLIPNERRVRAWYNLGNAILKQAGSDNVLQLRSAISCYENALDGLTVDGNLRDDVIYNLELAKLLWAKANAKQPQPNSPNEEPPERQPEPKKDKEPSPKVDEAKSQEKNPSKGKDQSMKSIDKKGNESPKETEEKKKTPGAGRLPVLKDDSAVQPLSPEDTRNTLQRIDERLSKERLNLRKEAAAGVGDRDW